jgi:hypothetical protein
LPRVTAMLGLPQLGDPELHRAIRVAENTGEKLHGAVIALYGAICQLLVGLAEFEDRRRETLAASIHRRVFQKSLSVLREFYEQMSSVIADDGVDPDKMFEDWHYWIAQGNSF